MKISGASGPATAGAASSPARIEVEAERTPVSRADLRAAIRRALSEGGGPRPSDELVDVLTAHASLETASGSRMYNFNFAGIKGRSPRGATAVCRTREVVDGREVTIRDGFRAYQSVDEGARDYVRLMRGQFRASLEPASRGDVAGFAAELKKARYYTASEADYARGLSSLLGVATTSPTEHGSRPTQAVDLGLSTTELSRVEDILSAERWLGGVSPFSSSSSSSRRAHRLADEDDDS